MDSDKHYKQHYETFMRLADPIQLRLTEQQKREYAEEAAARGLTLNEFLRERLTEGDQVSNQLHSLRLLLEEHREAEAPRGGVVDPEAKGMMLEMLLLLRKAIGDKDSALIHGEVKRHGLYVWRGEK